MLRRWIGILMTCGVAITGRAAQLTDEKTVPIPAGKDLLKIVAINVNAETIGDSFLIVTPNRKVMLIDAGEMGYGTKVILPYLAKQGIKAIDWLVISHPHSDHFGGAGEIIGSPEVKVKTVLWSTLLPYEELKKLGADFPAGEQKAYQAMMTAIQAKKVPLQDVHEGQILTLDKGITVEILAAAAPKLKVPNYINNNSIIFRLRYGQFAMIFTGDGGFEEENRILARTKDLKVDVLKLGHHAGAGSTGEAWLAALKPTVGISPMPPWLSPDPRGLRVEAQIKKAGIRFYRTWEFGHIDLLTDGHRYWIKTQKNKE